MRNCSHLRRGEIERDVVLLGAEHRLAARSSRRRRGRRGSRRGSRRRGRRRRRRQAIRQGTHRQGPSSGQDGIDVAGIGVVGQVAKIRCHPVCRRSTVPKARRWRLAEGDVEAVAAERGEAVEAALAATSRAMVVNSKESAGTAALRPASTAVLEALDVDLDEGRAPASRIRPSRVRQGTVTVASQTWPSQPPAPSRPHDEGVGGGRDGRVRRVELERRSRPRASPAAASTSVTVRIAAMDQAQGAGRARLRLERDDARAEPAEGRDAVADMGADVEGEVAGLQEARIERVHRAVARRSP